MDDPNLIKAVWISLGFIVALTIVAVIVARKKKKP